VRLYLSLLSRVSFKNELQDTILETLRRGRRTRQKEGRLAGIFREGEIMVDREPHLEAMSTDELLKRAKYVIPADALHYSYYHA
jgi:hypothetical protein